MKYIYYVIAVMVVFSGLAAYGLFDNARLEISQPLITVNDRIISENEFEKMLARKPSYMTREQFMDSVIEKQLLIQQAVKMGINKEENFRQSVENFYEQSLIKILLDRKLDSIIVDVSSDEIEKYRIYSAYTFEITKSIFPTLADFQNKTHGTIEKIEQDFINLSDDLKFTVMHLAQGETSRPQSGRFGVAVYTLDSMKKNENAADAITQDFDIKKVSLYIQDKKKEQVMDEWMDQIRKSAEIWRKNEK